MPLELKIFFHDGTDTLIKVFNNINNQTFTFDFNKQPDSLNFDPFNKIILKQVSTTIGIKNLSKNVPDRYFLFQNYPNPFNPSTIIRFQIPNSENGKWKMENGLVILKVYDIIGKEVATLVNEKLQPGVYEVPFSEKRLASGMYFYKLVAGNFSDVRRMVFVK